MIIRGQNTHITKLQRRHVDEMQFWGAHKDPLFYNYNFPKMDRQERDYWFSKKKNSFTRKSFAIFNEEEVLVGYLSLRNIKVFRRSSELGIVFDPNNLNKGYGTDSLQKFIPYYFEVLKMKRLDLRVAEFNIRAQKCYINCGFKIDHIQYNEFEDQSLSIFDKDELAEFRQFFKMQGNELHCRFIHMYITKEMYTNNKGSYPHYPPNTCA